MTLQEYLSLFPGATREKPRFMALAEAVLRQAMDLQALTEELQSGFSLARAEGIQLDAFAEALGIRRADVGSSVSDAAFRQYLLAKLALWRWDGTNKTVRETLEAALPGRTETDNMDGTITVNPGGNRKELLPVPAGVRVVNNS